MKDCNSEDSNWFSKRLCLEIFQKLYPIQSISNEQHLPGLSSILYKIFGLLCEILKYNVMLVEKLVDQFAYVNRFNQTWANELIVGDKHFLTTELLHNGSVFHDHV